VWFPGADCRRAKPAGCWEVDRVGGIDLRADLNAVDDECRCWALLTDAADPAQIVPGAVLSAGTERFWSMVRIDQVDDDGQVHFVPVSETNPAAAGSSTPSASDALRSDRDSAERA
jgi:hypothetical protein